MSAVLESAESAVAPKPETRHDPPTDLGAILRKTPPLGPATEVDRVAELMLDARYMGLLSLPIVHEGRPLGLISRYELMRVYLMRYGRELYGHRAIGTLANREALVIAVGTPIDHAARLVAERIPSPITDDFLIVGTDGRYLGTGVVLDVLRAMDARLAQRGAELERAYAHVKSSRLQLVQSEKMASLGQMVAGLVHEINTPLGYVRNNVDMTRSAMADAGRLLGLYGGIVDNLLDASGEPPADLAERMREAGELAQRVDAQALADLGELLDDSLHGLGQIGELIDNLRNFSRLDQGLMQKADINQLIASALRIVQHVLRKRGIEVLDLTSAVPEIVCAPAQINQVLLNLLNNAAQAIEHARGRITVRTLVSGGRLIVVVEDNGKGIAPEHIERIFDPFFTTKEIGQGTGLGLSIAHQIVSQHGGLLRVVSRPGVGTRFLMALPLVARGAGA